MIIFLGNEDGYEDLIKNSNEDKDIVVSCQYRYKVPESLLDSHICINIHYGMLPYFKGCNPIYWQIMKGGSAGVTIHYMDKNFDTGDIIAQWECPVGNMTADELYKVLHFKGIKLFKSIYKKIIDGTAPRKKQLSEGEYYNKSSVNFSDDIICEEGEKFINSKKLQALHFKGKQVPKIVVDGVKYEISRC